ncbi:bifunctional 2-polyprenyl-6-hydroxyphenol methylase/3-demethylubiquinol 3-O-methyltransferase UbiG [Micromonospora sp. HUAS LYJ1]|uniref:class I SAM-dependent methyltransferase n=1 Tax=Micromonospora sp. HUAS LYJ1 TaxID=3061626 RepID=UPI0026730CD4|nr:methyltransferase domain-containing protein [Micromonospora sp. HUAS LYJ1]WKU03480.1 methyltransferase domain-containing protein [Micromonospora sp. HUAS LYJ1]WKU07277.1 methyltransferase domain-containing protein [Micromonospora sp. HUAS LYJ1]
MTTTGQHYQFRNSPHQLHPLQDVLDPHTIRELARVGVKAGMRALDIGAGAGSITRHLAGLVGPDGNVTAVDLDTQLLNPTSSIDVYQRDLRTQPIPTTPDGYHVIHARCLLEHLPNRMDLLRQAIDLLRPGGWLVLGEIIYSRIIVHRAPTEPDASLITRVIHGVLDTLADHGVDLHWGETTPALLLAAGMNHVHARSHTETWTGGGPGCALYANNTHQLHDHLTDTGLTVEDLARFTELMADPYVVVSSYQFTTVHAQKPEPTPPS